MVFHDLSLDIMDKLHYQVSIPIDNGFWGRECKNCNKYFKIDSDKQKDSFYCPYCGELQTDSSLITKEQSETIDQYAQQIGRSIVEEELDRIFGNLAQRSKHVRYNPGPRTKISQPTSHVEKGVDSEQTFPPFETAWYRLSLVDASFLQ